MTQADRIAAGFRRVAAEIKTLRSQMSSGGAPARLTKAQYASSATNDEATMYFITDWIRGYQFFRWTVLTVLDTQNGVSPTSQSGAQASELQFYDGSGSRIVPNTMSQTNATASPAGASEGPAQLNDNSTDTKWYTPTLSGAQITAQFGSYVRPAAYAWYTANDVPGRDPVSWTLEASDNGTTWRTLDAKTSYATTSDRKTRVGPFAITT